MAALLDILKVRILVSLLALIKALTADRWAEVRAVVRTVERADRRRTAA
jgi:hypothetical protein